MDGHFIVMLVQSVVFMTPVVIIFYRLGRRDQILDETVKDLNGLGKKVAEIRDQQIQCLTEIKAQMDNMNSTLIRLTTLMEVMDKSVEEIKKR